MPSPAAGKVVMVSGANRGIGLSIARRLHAGGFRLSLGVRLPDRTEWAHGLGSPLLCRYEARDPATARAWVTETVARFGRIDALVNSAGVHHPLRFDAEDVDDDEAFAEMLAVNCTGPWHLSRVALSALGATQGRIVNIVSVSGQKATGPDDAGYCVSKFAAMGVSEVARAAARSLGVGVTALCPGWVDTAMGPGEGHPRVVRPEEIAACVAHVLDLPSRVEIPEMIVNDTLDLE